MRARARMTSKGQVTIPVSVRNALGVKQGDVLVFEKKSSSQFVVHAEDQAPSLEGMFRRYARSRPVSLEEMDDAIARGGRKARRRRR